MGTDPAPRKPAGFQFGLDTLLQASSVFSVLLGVPLVGRLVLGSMLLGFAILAGLILLQLPVFIPILLWDRARRLRAEEEREYEALLQQQYSQSTATPGLQTPWET